MTRSCESKIARHKRYIKEHTCLNCGKAVTRKNQTSWYRLCLRCQQRAIPAQMRRYCEKRLKVLTLLCDGDPHCQCPGCKTTFIRFLQIDHRSGDGAKDRRNGRRMKGTDMLLLILRMKNPKRVFQVLCANCNSTGGKGARERCPLHGQNHY